MMVSKIGGRWLYSRVFFLVGELLPKFVQNRMHHHRVESIHLFISTLQKHIYQFISFKVYFLVYIFQFFFRRESICVHVFACVCVCVCVCERERERERVCVYLCSCVFVSVRECVCVRVCVCVCVRERERERVCVCVYLCSCA